MPKKRAKKLTWLFWRLGRRVTRGVSCEAGTPHHGVFLGHIQQKGVDSRKGTTPVWKMSAWFPFKTQGKHQKGVHSKKGATCGRQKLPAFGTHALFRISPNEAAVSKSPRGQAFISAMFRRPLNLRLTVASIWQGSLATVIVIPVKETMTPLATYFRSFDHGSLGQIHLGPSGG